MKVASASMSLRGVALLGLLVGGLGAPSVYADDDARRATPAPGKSLIFVFRSERETVSSAVPVSVNGARVGELANGTFVTVTVKPGTTFLRAGDRVLTTLALEAEVNKSYFVWVEGIPGVLPVRSEMRLVSESAGRRSIAQSRFVGVAPVAAVATPQRQPSASSPRPAPSQPQPPVASDNEWKVAIIPKAGTFKLAEGRQIVGGLPSDYDTKSGSVLGFEVEGRNATGLALGGEVFSYQNDLAASGTALRAEQKVLAAMANAKYYFRAASALYPFVGGGIGFASVSYSGDLTGDINGFAYQGMAGIEFRIQQFGISAQYKFLSSTAEDSSGEKIKVGGSGVLLGLSVTF